LLNNEQGENQMAKQLTAEQIERRAERAMDRLDRALMTGIITQAEYDREVSIADKWAQIQSLMLRPLPT
jgi:hypothetical protein